MEDEVMFNNDIVFLIMIIIFILFNFVLQMVIILGGGIFMGNDFVVEYQICNIGLGEFIVSWFDWLYIFSELVWNFVMVILLRMCN